jgi:sigma-B regulation protein RsbU (phosphoserine phosphatase)
MKHFHKDFHEVLRSMPIFSMLPIEEQALLLGSVQPVEYDADVEFVWEGDIGDHLYIIVEGQVAIIKGMNTPDEYVIAMRSNGDLVGEMSLLNNNIRTASVRTVTPVKLLKLSHQLFEELMARRPQIAYEVVRILSQRLDEANNSAIADLKETNLQLVQANTQLQAAQTEIIEKKKIERELEVACEIQMSILPSEFPDLEGFSFGAQLVPARMVGGDLFDFIELDRNRVGVVIGDVSDKGVPASIFMAQARALIRAEASRAYYSPREVLRRVNAHLLDMNARGLFVTAIYGVVDKRDHSFVYARAGHENPLIIKPDGQIESLERRRGLLLGVFDEVTLEEQTVTIEPGSTLFLYTDGGTDNRDADEEPFGMERLIQTLDDTYGMNAQEICRYVLAALSNFRHGMAPYDDVTLVAVQATAR